MARNIWDGSTDSDWATAANWTSAAVPVNDDEVIFDASSLTNAPPTTGMGDDGANNSGIAANGDLDLLHFKKGYTAGIGTAALPLTVFPEKIIIEGSGTYYINCGSTDQNTSATVPLVIVNNPDAIVNLFSNVNDGTQTSEFTDVYVIAGTVNLALYTADTEDTSPYVANLHLAPRNRKESNVTVTIAQNAFKINGSTRTNIKMAGGTLTTDSVIGTLDFADGTINYGTDLGGSPDTNLNITLIHMYGGTFNWTPDDSTEALIGALHLYGGTFDASSATNNDRVKAITTTFLYQGASLNIANNKGNITLTDLWNFAGTLITDRGARIAVTYDQP